MQNHELVICSKVFDKEPNGDDPFGINLEGDSADHVDCIEWEDDVS